MSDNTKIEWADATVNAVNGCSVVSPGCTNCYAMRLAGTRMKHHPSRAGLTTATKAGPVWNGEVRFHEPALLQVLRWRRPRKIFWNAHGDLFHENVPDEWIDRCFAVMALTPQHIHQVLTKRSARMREYFSTPQLAERWCDESVRHSADAALAHVPTLPLPNVWLGVSAEDQQRWNERTDDLLATPAAIRFVSAEPLLGPIVGSRPADRTYRMLSTWYGPDGFDETGSQPERTRQTGYFPLVDWIVAGGESGPGARPMHPNWARSLRDQCAAAGAAFHFKQWGEWAPGDAFGLESDEPVTDRFGNVRDWTNRYVVCADRADRLRGHSFTEHATNLVYRVGKKRAGRMLDGVQHDGFPA